MKLIFHDIGADDWQLGHLMTQRIWVAPAQGLVAAATNRGLAGDRFTHLGAWDQEALLTLVPALAAALLPCRLGVSGRSPLGVKAVRGWREGGVAGIERHFA